MLVFKNLSSKPFTMYKLEVASFLRVHTHIHMCIHTYIHIYLYMYVTQEVSNSARQRCLQHFLDLYWKM